MRARTRVPSLRSASPSAASSIGRFPVSAVRLLCPADFLAGGSADFLADTSADFSADFSVALFLEDSCFGGLTEDREVLSEPGLVSS